LIVFLPNFRGTNWKHINEKLEWMWKVLPMYMRRWLCHYFTPMDPFWCSFDSNGSTQLEKALYVFGRFYYHWLSILINSQVVDGVCILGISLALLFVLIRKHFAWFDNDGEKCASTNVGSIVISLNIR
jgi:hypothetical protein